MNSDPLQFLIADSLINIEQNHLSKVLQKAIANF